MCRTGETGSWPYTGDAALMPSDTVRNGEEGGLANLLAGLAVRHACNTEARRAAGSDAATPSSSDGTAQEGCAVTRMQLRGALRTERAHAIAHSRRVRRSSPHAVAELVCVRTVRHPALLLFCSPRALARSVYTLCRANLLSLEKEKNRVESRRNNSRHANLLLFMSTAVFTQKKTGLFFFTSSRARPSVESAI